MPIVIVSNDKEVLAINNYLYIITLLQSPLSSLSLMIFMTYYIQLFFKVTCYDQPLKIGQNTKTPPGISIEFNTIYMLTCNFSASY